MPHHLFAKSSQKFLQPPQTREERQKVDTFFGNTPGAGVVVGRAFTREGFGIRSDREPEDPQLEEEVTRRSDDKFKVRQGWSFLDEAAFQMEGLYLMLSALQGEKLGSTAGKLAGRAVASSVVSGASGYAGATLGALGGPAGAIAGGMAGAYAGKRIYRNLEKEIGKKYNLNAKISGLYPSAVKIDAAISSAYLMRKTAPLTSGDAHLGSALQTLAVTAKHLGSKWFKYLSVHEKLT